MNFNKLLYKYNEFDELISLEEYQGESIIYSYSIKGKAFVKNFINEESTQIKIFDSVPKMYIVNFSDYYIVKIKDELKINKKLIFHLEKINGFLFPCLIHDVFIKKFEYLLKK